MRNLKTFALLLFIAASLIFLQFNPLPNGISFSKQMYALNKLKNRTVLPQGFDYDNRVTLNGLLQPGEDSARWSETSAAGIEGYVVAVSEAGIESANCYSFFQRDTHIEVALSQDASPRERVVLEVTPRIREWAKGQGWDWSTGALTNALVGHWCRFEGWLFFDIWHKQESENINPGGDRNWRATAWEIHPVTAIKIIR